MEKTLAGINARVVTYDSLIASALDSYKDYLEKNTEVSRLHDLIRRLEESEHEQAVDDGSEETSAS